MKVRYNTYIKDSLYTFIIIQRIMALLLTFVMLPIFMANSSPWVGITSHPPYENYDDRLSEGFFDVQIDSVAQHRGSNHRSKRVRIFTYKEKTS